MLWPIHTKNNNDREGANSNTEVPLSANPGWLITNNNHRLITVTVNCAFI